MADTLQAEEQELEQEQEQEQASPEVPMSQKEDESPKLEPQFNGVLVLTLLDKVVGMVDQIQTSQQQLERRHLEMENAVFTIQNELSKLTKSHATSSNSVTKMLEKIRKVSVNVKTIKHNMEKQAAQIKKLETNEAVLLKRNNFKVMIYQDETPMPAKLSLGKSVKESLKEPEESEQGKELVSNEEKPEGENISLSSDEEIELEIIEEETTAVRLKKSSMKRMDNIKKAFSKETMEKAKQRTKENLQQTRLRTKQNMERTKQMTKENLEKTKHTLEKKMNKLGNKIVTQEQKEKLRDSRSRLRKSFTPNHQKLPRSRTTVYRIPPFTFWVKKMRDGDVVVQEVEMIEGPGEEHIIEDEDNTDLLIEEIHDESLEDDGDLESELLLQKRSIE
ncbi:caveolae-associated protein 1-like [Narcine bancroftii]|uniref:caveolae-associated protein 1-like n=1 Tax=Narcine bancroftii TaxID=1343680 RepID=UPI003831DA2B